MKKAIPIIVLVILAGIVGYVLVENRKTMEEATSLAEARVENVPVTIHEVTSDRITEDFRLSGKLAADDDLMLMATTQGRINRIFVKKGDRVSAGQVVASVESELFREQYDVAQSAYEKLKKDAERFRIMAESEAITQQQLEGVELNLKQAEAAYLAAKKQYEDTRVTSPVSGYVNQLFIKTGGIIGPGVPVAEIVNNDQLTLSLKIPEQDLQAVREAVTVPVTLGTARQDTVKGTISFTSIKPDYSGLYPVEIALEATDGLVAGQLATAHFTRVSNPDISYVPHAAILGFGEAAQYVFIVSEGRARRTAVKPLETLGDFVGVSGLNVNDQVILKGNTIVTDGQSIQIP